MASLPYPLLQDVVLRQISTTLIQRFSVECSGLSVTAYVASPIQLRIQINRYITEDRSTVYEYNNLAVSCIKSSTYSMRVDVPKTSSTIYKSRLLFIPLFYCFRSQNNCFQLQKSTENRSVSPRSTYNTNLQSYSKTKLMVIRLGYSL